MRASKLNAGFGRRGETVSGDVMKKLLLATTTIVALMAAESAGAADLSIPPGPKSSTAAVYDWTGFYAGAHLGYNLNDPELVTSSSTTVSAGAISLENAAISPPGSANNTTGGRFVGGGQVGVNMQTGIWVYGVEADISAGRRRIGNNASSNFNGITGPGSLIQNFSAGEVEDDWYGTVRGRLGIARDHWLVYGSAGFAYGELKTTNTSNPIVVAFPIEAGSISAATSSQIRGGWAAGAGAAYAWSDTVSLFVEWTRVDLGSQSAVSGLLVNSGGTTVNLQGRSDVGAKFDVIQVGVNLKIN
jgi:outer membrane immunogenic protein